MSDRTCLTPGCERPVKARGLCMRCYGLERRRRTPETSGAPRPARHSLADVDEDSKRGVCAICGPVAIRIKSARSDKGRYRCAVKEQSHNKPDGVRRPDKRPLEVRRIGVIKRTYGLSEEAYRAMYEAQGGRCRLCRDKKPLGGAHGLFVDHDHLTGQIRGLLCRACNTGLGFLRDDPELLMKAARYVSSNRQLRIVGV